MQELNHRKLDWVVVGLYLLLVVFGWMNIFSSSATESGFVFSLNEKYVMDLIWIASSLILAVLILFVIPSKVYTAISWPFYGLMVFLLVAVAFLGKEVN